MNFSILTELSNKKTYSTPTIAWGKIKPIKY